MLSKLASVTNPFQAVVKLFIKKPITYNFPPETPISRKSRGRHIFDPKECIGCSLCAKICPNIAIEMVANNNRIKAAKHDKAKEIINLKWYTF